MNPKKRLGQMLIEAGVIDETQLRAALGHQRQWGVRLGQALVDLKLASEPDIVRSLSVKFGYAVAQLDALEPYGLEQALKLFPREFVVRNNVFPMAVDTATVTVAMSDPTNLAVVDEIGFRTGRRVKVCIGGDREIATAVGRHYRRAEDVQAIALDLDADDGEPQALYDPFGGGSKDALDAFFESQSDAGAPGAAPPPPATSGRGNGPSPRTTSGGTGHPPGVVPTGVPAAPLAGGAGPLELDLEGGSFGVAGDGLARLELEPLYAEDGEEPELVPLPEELAEEPILGTLGEELSDEQTVERSAPAAREFADFEIAILESLERLASGAPAEPEIVKPAQAMAAVVRLLLRKQIVTEQEFLDELRRK
jgi:hypothetical protein